MDSGGGHRLRGGTTSNVSPTKGNNELNRTAGIDAVAVARSQASSTPSCAMAEHTAASLWQQRMAANWIAVFSLLAMVLIGNLQRAVKIAVRPQPAGRRQAAPEVVRVEAAGPEPQQVAAASGDDRPGRRLPRSVRVAARPVRLDNAAEPGDIGVDTALGAGRRLVSPDRVD